MNPDVIDNFINTWAKKDPDASGLMHTSEFKDFMYQLGPPLGWKKDQNEEAEELYIILKSQILKVHDEHFQFNEVLDAIIMMSVIFEEAKKAQMKHESLEENSDKISQCFSGSHHSDKEETPDTFKGKDKQRRFLYKAFSKSINEITTAQKKVKSNSSFNR